MNDCTMTAWGTFECVEHFASIPMSLPSIPSNFGSIQKVIPPIPNDIKTQVPPPPKLPDRGAQAVDVTKITDVGAIANYLNGLAPNQVVRNILLLQASQLAPVYVLLKPEIQRQVLPLLDMVRLKVIILTIDPSLRVGLIQELAPRSLGDVLMNATPQERTTIVPLITAPIFNQIIMASSLDKRGAIVAMFPVAILVQALPSIPVADLRQILAQLPPNIVAQVLTQLPTVSARTTIASALSLTTLNAIVPLVQQDVKLIMMNAVTQIITQTNILMRSAFLTQISPLWLVDVLYQLQPDVRSHVLANAQPPVIVNILSQVPAPMRTPFVMAMTPVLVSQVLLITAPDIISSIMPTLPSNNVARTLVSTPLQSRSTIINMLPMPTLVGTYPQVPLEIGSLLISRMAFILVQTQVSLRPQVLATIPPPLHPQISAILPADVKQQLFPSLSTTTTSTTSTTTTTSNQPDITAIIQSMTTVAPPQRASIILQLPPSVIAQVFTQFTPMNRQIRAPVIPLLPAAILQQVFPLLPPIIHFDVGVDFMSIFMPQFAQNTPMSREMFTSFVTILNSENSSSHTSLISMCDSLRREFVRIVSMFVNYAGAPLNALQLLSNIRGISVLGLFPNKISKNLALVDEVRIKELLSMSYQRLLTRYVNEEASTFSQAIPVIRHLYDISQNPQIPVQFQDISRTVMLASNDLVATPGRPDALIFLRSAFNFTFSDPTFRQVMTQRFYQG
jgi:Mg/Co/Ni transporter MgtE